ncbi:MAG: aspartate carbamoyltransferase [Armatimonadetes bacterium]|jgi:aspartate carbamoyltransferase catalytic subunit|nr:aspartate carbamoyltransferase [Armatimonadota bacterium]
MGTTEKTPGADAVIAESGGLRRKDVLSLQDLSAEEIETVLRNAAGFKEIMARPIKKVPTLRGKSVVTLFYENSTRTRASFELAAKVMSADAINISASSSSVSKGESLKDTALTMQALGMDMIVIRHPLSGAPEYVAKTVGIPVINAGDGMHEHPSQGLLDLFTLRETRGDIAGLKVLIVGDILHSRVARSNIWGLLKLGAEVRVCGPSTLLPWGIETLGVQRYESLDEAMAGVDVVNVLRIQLERQERGLFPTLREYSERWGVSPRRLEKAADNVTVMHPGPMNRGVEISPEVADAGYAVIEQQVTNGVAVRMALLYLLLGAQGA